jgi:hypothetical protein
LEEACPEPVEGEPKPPSEFCFVRRYEEALLIGSAKKK